MLQRLTFFMAALVFWHPCAVLAQPAGNKIISDALAARHGLTRPWFTQVEMNQGDSRLLNLILYEGILYAQTDRAMIQAIDAETGATLWAKQIGRPEHPSLAPGIGHSLLAVVNGSRLYVANRLNGKILLETEIDGAPGAGPAVSNERVYVPTISGLLMAYRIEQKANPLEELAKENLLSSEESAKQKSGDSEPGRDFRLSQQASKFLSYQSVGRLLVQPLVTKQTDKEEYIVWPTDRGYMYIGRINRESPIQIEVKYRLQTAAPITAQPTYIPPDPGIAGDSGLILAASGDGYVHAILEKTGESLWRFATGEPLSQPAVIIDECVYAATSLNGGLYCINAKTGAQIWHAPGIVQFISAGKNRVYAADKMGQTCVLDAANGAQLDVLPTAALPVKMLNDDSDRIYLATSHGLIQCLREIGLPKPIMYGDNRNQAAQQAEKTGTAKKTEEKTVEKKTGAKKEASAKTPPKKRESKKSEEQKNAQAEEEQQPADEAKKTEDATNSKEEKDPFAE